MNINTQLRLGIGKVDITPPLGVDLSGYVARRGTSRGIHDRLYSKAVCFEQGDKRILLIANDILSIGLNLSSEVKRLIQKKLDFPGENVIITATHTHSGPATINLKGCGKIDRDYIRKLPKKMVTAAAKAMESMKHVRVQYSQFEVKSGENRREKGGYVDHSGAIIRFVADSGETIASIVHYNCHPVVLTHTNLLISADYPGVITRSIEKVLGGICIFLAGAIGDVDPIHRGTFQKVENMGKAIANAALNSLKSQKELEGELQLLLRSMEIPSEDILPEAVEREIQSLQKASDPSSVLKSLYIEDRISLHWLGRKIARVYLEWYDEVKTLKEHGVGKVLYDLNIRVLNLGELVLVFLPGEPHALVGKKIKDALLPKVALTVGYADDHLGYIPNEETYRLGGYEILQANRYYGLPAVVGKGTEAMIVRTLMEMLHRCR